MEISKARFTLERIRVQEVTLGARSGACSDSRHRTHDAGRTKPESEGRGEQ
jgi:hypothetical protein